jgi:hypothetical protein
MQGSEAVLCCAELCWSVGNSISGGRASLNKLPALQYIPALESRNKETPEKQGRLEQAACQDGSVQTTPDHATARERKQ